MANEESTNIGKKKIWILVFLIVVVFGVWYFAFPNCAICNLFSSNNSENTDNNSEIFQTDVSVDEAYLLINESYIPDNFLILDVRTQSEFDAGHIENATLIPYDTIQENLNILLPFQNKTILVYCRSGNRSNIASGTLIGLNFTKVFNMLGGFTEWLAAGYPSVN